MSADKKLLWLKWILVAKVFFIVFLWGLPLLLLPLSLLQLLGVPVPDAPIYLRLSGALITAFGVAYWIASKDPLHNIAVLKAGIVDNGLVTLVLLVFIIFYGLRSILMLVSVPLAFFFFISFLLLLPKPETP